MVSGSTSALDWTLRILPAAFCFFGLAWCVWVFRKTADAQQESTLALHQLEEPKTDPIDLAKSRGFIASKLIIRKVSECSSDGAITFSDPITRESSSCNVIRKERTGSESDSDIESRIGEHNEKHLPPQDCENGVLSQSCSAERRTKFNKTIGH